MAPLADILPPRYRDARLVGRGGMGEIYRATDEALGREVAVKVLSEAYAGDADVRERFKREALAAARLSAERNAVTIFDVGEWEGRPYIVMEYVPGGSLADRLGQGTPPLPDALGWLEQAAEALDAAHEQGIVHRDVKPGNLLLDADGRVLVADFGVASAAGLASLTRTGTVLGTAGYLSPEQARGERATPASDRYALAVVAWELLTGRRPFQSETPTAEAAAHATAPVPPISEARRDLPATLDAVFVRALAKEPAERYGSSVRLVEAIRSGLEDDATATEVAVSGAAPATAATRRLGSPAPPERGRRRGLAVPLALAGLLALGLVGLAVAAGLTDGDGEESSRTVVSTVERTLPGTTVEREVTVTEAPPPPPPEEEPPPPPPPQEPPPPPPSGGTVEDAVALTDESTALNNAGDYAAGLDRAQQALAILQGSGETYEGYANFNAGNALAHLGRCGEALPYLNRRLQWGGGREEVAQAKALCAGGGDD